MHLCIAASKYLLRAQSSALQLALSITYIHDDVLNVECLFVRVAGDVAFIVAADVDAHYA